MLEDGALVDGGNGDDAGGVVGGTIGGETVAFEYGLWDDLERREADQGAENVAYGWILPLRKNVASGADRAGAD
ncbi:hypothetical protein FRC12_003875 [Ceratobasidium sp. 428]|nr:hypothetical protein FRC12_003875 [Ceratobasidium sp. 428]